MAKKIEILDTTLRDGAQAESISFSVRDKLEICSALDALGVAVVEAGNPGSNPKDREFFSQATGLGLRHAVISAFGSTCRPGLAPADDPQIAELLDAGTSTICLVGKAWRFHVAEILKTTDAENLRMIGDSVSWLVSRGRRVIFDAEQFFNG